jgi:hypothetical protein
VASGTGPRRASEGGDGRRSPERLIDLLLGRELATDFRGYLARQAQVRRERLHTARPGVQSQQVEPDRFQGFDG